MNRVVNKTIKKTATPRTGRVIDAAASKSVSVSEGAGGGLSHSHVNKALIDLINQGLSTESSVQFKNIETPGYITAGLTNGTPPDDLPIATNQLYGVVKIDGVTIKMNLETGAIYVDGGTGGVSSWSELTDKPANLVAIAALSGAGILKRNTDGSFALDTSTFLTAITKAMVEAVLTGTITSHQHNYMPSSGGNFTNPITVLGQKVWYEGNDGASSGLDADTLDTFHETAFPRILSTSGNLNSLTRTGMYIVFDGAYNIPTGATALGAHVVHFNWDANSAVQMYYNWADDRVWTRRKIGSSVWNGWIPLWNSTSDGAGSGLDADLLDGLQKDAYMRYEGWVNNPGYNANTMAGNTMGFTYANNAPYVGPIINIESGGYNLEINAQYNNDSLIAYRVKNADSGTWNTWRSFYNSANANLKTVDWAAKNVNAVNGYFDGALTAGAANNTPPNDLPIATSLLYGVIKSGLSLHNSAGVININGRHYTTTSTYTDAAVREITAELSLGTGSMGNGTLDQIQLSFAPLTTTRGLTANVIATNTGAGMGLKLSFRKDTGTGRWYIMIYNDSGAAVTRDGISLSIRGQQII